MKSYRHSVEKIRPEISSTLDQQFWPVLIAIIVLCSVAAGAIATLITGPWMWGSLLLLPAAAALAIFLLFKLDNTFLRRSLQFAILISLALHLLILVVSSLTFIFSSAYDKKEIVVSKTPEKRMIVSNRTRKFVFEETSKHEIQDPKQLEPEKQHATKIQNKTQPVPVEEQTKTMTPQIQKRETQQQSISRLARKQSLRSRNTTSKPNSSSQASVSQSKRTESSQPQPSPSKTQVTKITEVKQSAARSAKSSPISPQRNIQNQAGRRQSQSQKFQQQANASSARIRKSETRIPKIASRRSDQTQPSKSQEPIAKIVNSVSPSSNVSRSSVSKSTTRKSSTSNSSQSKASVVSSVQRRSDSASTLPIKSRSTPKRSERQISAKSPSAPNNPQTVQTAASAKLNKPTPQPKNLALSRSKSGVLGTGRSSNLDRTTGGQSSPVKIASNASSKRQSNRASENVSLTSSQQSDTMERGRSELSKHALKSETAHWASKTGSSSPAKSTAQASSANIDSASASSRDSVASEKGSSMVNIGATKVVPEAVADRRGGGGLPELNNAISQPTPRESGSRSNQLPTVANNSLNSFAGDSPQIDDVELSNEQGNSKSEIAKQDQRQSFNSSSGKLSALDEDSQSSTEVNANSISSSANRREHEQSEFASSSSAELSGENPSDGNQRSRIAQAPKVERSVNFGSEGTSDFDVSDPTVKGSEFSTVELVKRAANSLSGGSAAGTASKVMATSLAGLPLFANGISDSKRRNDRESKFGDKNDPLSESSSRTGRRLSPIVSPAPAVSSSSQYSSNTEPTESNEALGIQRQQVANSKSSSAIKLEIEAPEGSGGIGQALSRRAGSPTDAVTESENLSPAETRFKRREFGGLPLISPNTNIAKEAFRGRNPANLSDSGPQTERAIELGLEFLARCQLADGSWTLGQFDNEDPYFQNQLNSDTAATGLALLAFQGAGYNHREFNYATQVKNALDWLVSNQSDDGGLYVESDAKSNELCRLYSHAIAALALAEAYGMTQDQEIRSAAQMALDYIADTQHSKRGGWRYYTRPDMRSSDTSVTGWMMMALKSGELAGLDIKKQTMDGIEKWLFVAEVPKSNSQFRYNPYAKDSDERSRSHGKKASVSMTSVGLLMRVYTGWGPTDQRFLQGADHLLGQLPSDKNSRVRDTYYWYYATQVLRHAGGERWEIWASRLHPLLVQTQEQNGPLSGSWHPYKPVPDRWAPQGGRIFVTTMNLLSLEVKYRLLPLYENTIKSDN